MNPFLTGEMTLQWSIVAAILYAEIFATLVLLLPWIKPEFWRRIFNSTLVHKMSRFADTIQYSAGFVFILLFTDAIREVRKCSHISDNLEASRVAPADATIQKRLFHAQRNLYMVGMLVILYLAIANLFNAAVSSGREALDASETTKIIAEADGPNTIAGTLQSKLEELKTKLKTVEATKGASIWSVLRHSVGKDLSKVAVPIRFNEPLSYLQRLAEYMEYISLIKEASITDDPVKRLEVCLFSFSFLLLPQFGFKFIAEQVSHHPPISAFHSQGDEFEFYGNVEPKIKFWGRSLEDNPEAFFTLILKSHNETYTWKAASFSLHNLIMGKMYISLTGCIVIKCLENSLQTKIKFRGAGKQSGADTMFIGEVLKGKKHFRTIYGNWTQYIASTPYEKFVEFKIQWEKEYRVVEKRKNYNLVTLFPESRLLWRIHKKPPNCKEHYNLPYFSLALNEMLSDPLNLPKTDVRFRPDIRQMEEGNLDVASNEKERLEEKQRTTAKEKDGAPEPRWFTLGTDKGSQKTDAYIFNGKYWNRDFSHCEDIY
uniref:Oxysterol-binding protein n=1 Tax=Panagrolaimus sp. ES5 TaxID=591445 RepID=A0AC34EZA0_9BILA